MFKMYKAKFNTSEVTTETLQNDSDFRSVEIEVLELIATALNNVHDIEVAVAEWNYSPGNYSIVGHNEENDAVDAPLKELIWAFEQAGGIYCDERERFNADWSKGQYEPEGSLHLDKNWFEVIEFLKEVI